jgi:hypothetical protein
VQAVAEVVADDGVAPGAAGGVLDLGADIVALARLAVVGCAVERDRDGGRAVGVADRVGAGAGREDVAARARVPGVVLRAADDHVIPVSVVERVRARAAVERVVARVAVEVVVTLAAGERVAVGRAVELVEARAALDGERGRVSDLAAVGGVVVADQPDDERRDDHAWALDLVAAGRHAVAAAGDPAGLGEHERVRVRADVHAVGALRGLVGDRPPTLGHRPGPGGCGKGQQGGGHEHGAEGGHRRPYPGSLEVCKRASLDFKCT